MFVYGDPFVQASYSPDHETSALQVQARFAALAPGRLRVVNAGVDGYGPDRVLLRLDAELPRFTPDPVAITVFADNDLGDPIRNKLFRMGASGGLRRHRFVMDEEVRRHYAARERLDAVPALFKAVLEPGLLRRDLRILLERRPGIASPWLADTPIDSAYRTGTGYDWIEIWRQRGLDDFREFVVDGDPRISLDSIRSDLYDADVTTAAHSEPGRHKRRLMQALMGAIAQTLARHAVPALVLVVPAPIDACDGYDRQVERARYPAYGRRLLSASVETAAAAAGLPVVSLFDAFRGPRCNALYFHHGNNHWTVASQSLVAQRVAAAIDELWGGVPPRR